MLGIIKVQIDMNEVEWHNSALPNPISQSLLKSIQTNNPFGTSWQRDASVAATANKTSYDQELWLGMKGIVEYYERKLSQMEPKKYTSVPIPKPKDEPRGGGIQRDNEWND